VKNYCQVRSIGFKILIWLFFSNSFLLRAKTAVNHDTKRTLDGFSQNLFYCISELAAVPLRILKPIHHGENNWHASEHNRTGFS
jgi:hypothetical protein